MRSISVLLFAAASIHAVAGETERLASETRIPGAGNIAGLAVDTDGNIHAAGPAIPTGLPVVNAFRPVNTALPVTLSADAGASFITLPDTSFNRARSLVVSSSGDLIAGADNGIYRSGDGGRTWSRLPGDPPAAGVVGAGAIAIDPRQPRTLYVASANAGVIKTTDGGETWTRASNGLPKDPRGNGNLSFLVIDPFHPETLIGGLGSIGYRTDDGGQTWAPQDLALPPNSIFSTGRPMVAFDPRRPDIVYSYASYRLARSADRGRTWRILSVPAETVTVVAGDPVSAGVVYAGTSSGLFRSSDDGQSWQDLGLPAVSDAIAGLAIDPLHPARLLVFSFYGNWRSADSGKTWERLRFSRPVDAAVFDESGRLWLAGARSSDGFFARQDAAGVTTLSTYIGGDGEDTPQGLAVDGAGNTYIGGITTSVDLAVNSGAAQPAFGGGQDCFVMKVTSAGAIAWLTYLGGNSQDTFQTLKVDADGNVIVAGLTNSRNFPVTAGATRLGEPWTFVTKIAADGSRFLWSRILFGVPGALDVDRQGNIFLAGSTSSGDFPITGAAYQKISQGSPDGFVVKLSPGGEIVYATLLGGRDREFATGIAIDAAGAAYVTGYTASNDFRTSDSAYQRTLRASCPYPSAAIPTGFIGTILYHEMDDIFVAKLDPAGSALEWSTLLGGNCFDTANAISLTASGDVIVTGRSNSSPFPTVFGTESGPAYSQYKAVLARFDSGGKALRFSTYVNSTQNVSMALGPSGDIYVGGAQGYVAQYTESGAPALVLEGIGNAFKSGFGPVAPGEIVNIAVPGIAPEQEIDLGWTPSVPLPLSLDGLQVLFNGKPAPIVALRNGTILAVAPFGLQPGSLAIVEVVRAGARSNPMRVTVVPADVGMLSLDGTGTGRANIRNQDGTLNASGNPAHPGEFVTVFFTGGGQTDPASIDGEITPEPAPRLSGRFYVTIGQYGVPVDEVNALPGFIAGLYSARVRVPELGLAGDAVRTQVTVYSTAGSVLSVSQELTIAVR